MKCRKPFVAGRFYPNDKESILEFINSNIINENKKTKAIALIVPHAGYVFSGKIAFKAFQKSIIPKNIFFLSPNHSGYGSSINIDANEKWKTPLGYVNLNVEACNFLVKNSSIATFNNDAQLFEHAIEVNLPFLQYLNSDATIIPITIAETNIIKLEVFANELYNCVKSFGFDDSLIVCSSDMTHFENAQNAEKKDELAINEILKLDAISFYKTIKENKISMCGVYPATVLLFLLAKLNKEMKISSKLLQYTNSGEVTGDYKEIVAYASLEFVLDGTNN